MHSIGQPTRSLLTTFGLLALLAFNFTPVVAAEPLPSLDELLKQYKDLGLPLPPKDAKLVRMEWTGNQFINGKETVTTHVHLAFQNEPATVDVEWKSREVSPEPSAADGVTTSSLGSLVLAIECHSRGWTKLAQHLLEMSQKNKKDLPQEVLVRYAWNYWESQITKPKIDRAPAARRLKQIMELDKELDTKQNRSLVTSLELALVPSKAKPGSIEWLIDDLVNLEEEEFDEAFWWRPNKRIMAILDRGFEAVPALIDHVGDARLTRFMARGGRTMNTFYWYHFRVGEAVSDLLEGLVGRPLTEDWDLDRVSIDKVKVRKWFDEARKVGEEQYLIDHVLFPAAGEPRAAGTNNWQLALIQAKYPKHLPAIYRKVLDQYPKTFPIFARAVKNSKLPDKEKLEILIYAAKNRDAEQRVTALCVLQEMDKKQFDELLLPAIEAFPVDPEPSRGGSPSELGIVNLALSCDDVKVWPLLEKVARRSKVEFRVMVLRELGSAHGDGPKKSERLKLHASFLNDPTVYNHDKNDERFSSFEPRAYTRIEVRNFAALQIARILGVKIEENPQRMPEEWTKIREQMHEAVKREQERKE